MKIKLAYPKIPDTLNCPIKQCVAFEKLDGTNIHFVWSSETGFQHFGTRRDRFTYSDNGIVQFSQAHPELNGVAKAFSKMEEGLNNFLNDYCEYHEGIKEIILFAEYVGDNSFAGTHSEKDEKRLVLLDAQIDGVMLAPVQFIQVFHGFPTPKVVFEGKFTGQLFVDVRKGKYNVKEGVVVKGIVDKQVYMSKIKTDAYLQKLKESFKDNWKEYWE